MGTTGIQYICPLGSLRLKCLEGHITYFQEDKKQNLLNIISIIKAQNAHYRVGNHNQQFKYFDIWVPPGPTMFALWVWGGTGESLRLKCLEGHITYCQEEKKSKTYSTLLASLRHKMHTTGWKIFIRNLNTRVYGHQRCPIYWTFGYGKEQELVCC